MMMHSNKNAQIITLLCLAADYDFAPSIELLYKRIHRMLESTHSLPSCKFEELNRFHIKIKVGSSEFPTKSVLPQTFFA